MSRVIDVLSTRVISSGEKAGKPWTLYGVEANDSDGQPISHQLKSFSALPRGRVEVDIEVQDHPQYGTSYLLKPTGRGNGGGDGRSNDAGQLRERIERLESEVQRIAAIVDRRDFAMPSEAEPFAGGAAAGGFDEDIPF